jgi:hypothetical protein
MPNGAAQVRNPSYTDRDMINIAGLFFFLRGKGHEKSPSQCRGREDVQALSYTTYRLRSFLLAYSQFIQYSQVAA